MKESAWITSDTVCCFPAAAGAIEGHIHLICFHRVEWQGVLHPLRMTWHFGGKLNWCRRPCNVVQIRSWDVSTVCVYKAAMQEPFIPPLAVLWHQPCADRRPLVLLWQLKIPLHHFLINFLVGHFLFPLLAPEYLLVKHTVMRFIIKTLFLGLHLLIVMKSAVLVLPLLKRFSIVDANTFSLYWQATISVSMSSSNNR